uniref:Cytochrome b6-f complex iron-sulfur subunit 2ic-like n=1 Tax=Rhizophora mucronata TaxID=61149 RepID=A0A2P2K5P0_RHIMU
MAAVGSETATKRSRIMSYLLSMSGTLSTAGNPVARHGIHIPLSFDTMWVLVGFTDTSTCSRTEQATFARA